MGLKNEVRKKVPGSAEDIDGSIPRKKYKREENIEDSSTREQSPPSNNMEFENSAIQKILSLALEAFDREKGIPGKNMTQERFGEVFKFSRKSLLEKNSWSSHQLKKMSEQVVNRRLCQLLNLEFTTKQKQNEISHQKFLKKIKEKFPHKIPDIIRTLDNMEHFLKRYFDKRNFKVGGKSTCEISLEVVEVFQILKVKAELKKDYLSDSLEQEQEFDLWKLEKSRSQWLTPFFIENYSIFSVGY